MNLKTFSQTSDGLYDRHVYKLNVPGAQSIVFEDYDILRAVWFEKCRNFSGCTVEVLDVEKKSVKGFG
jgi:hypothetical protein